MVSQSPPSLPPSKVPIATVEKAVDSLLSWKSTKSSTEKPQLLPSDEFFYLVLTLTKIPSKSRVNAYKIPLPNSLYTPENAEFCLFVADENSKTTKAKIEEEKLPINKTLKLTKLKKEYKAYEQKRKLCDSYDLFFAEKKIVTLLPNAIGKWFYKKKKVPVPIELSRGNWKEQIDRVCNSGMLYLSSGSCSVIKVARASMERDDVVENVVAAINGVAEVVPKGWAGVRSFHLRFSGSVALPVYQKVPELGFKIAGFGGEEKKKAIEEKKNKDKKGKKGKGEDKEGVVVKKKGRIHEVRYMDDVMIGEDEKESESEVEEVVNEEEKAVEEEVVAVKKRKKSDVEKKEKKVKKVKKVDRGLKKVSSGKKLKKIKVSA